MRFDYDNIISRMRNNPQAVSSGEMALAIARMAAKIVDLEDKASEKKAPAPRKKKESDDG